MCHDVPSYGLHLRTSKDVSVHLSNNLVGDNYSARELHGGWRWGHVRRKWMLETATRIFRDHPPHLVCHPLQGAQKAGQVELPGSEFPSSCIVSAIQSSGAVDYDDGKPAGQQSNLSLKTPRKG